MKLGTHVVCMLILHPFASQREIFLKLDDANRPNQPTGQKPIKKDNFYKNCPIWLKFGMQVSHCPCPPLPPLPTHSVADPNTFQIFLSSGLVNYIKKSVGVLHFVWTSAFATLVLFLWFQSSPIMYYVYR